MSGSSEERRGSLGWLARARTGSLAVFERARRIEGRVLVLIAAAGAVLWAFALIADGVLDGEFREFDQLVLLALRDRADQSQPVGPSWLSVMMRDITGLGGHAVLTMVTLAVASFLMLTGRNKTARLVVVSVATGAILSSLMKLGFARPRPDLVPHAVEVYTNSFPSGHALLSAIVYLTLAALLARSQPDVRVKVFIVSVAVVLTVLIGLSRVYLGVHWPTDVLAGWTLGAGWALICWLLMIQLQRQGSVEPDLPR